MGAVAASRCWKRGNAVHLIDRAQRRRVRIRVSDAIRRLTARSRVEVSVEHTRPASKLQLPAISLSDLERRVSKPLHQLLRSQTNDVTLCVHWGGRRRLVLLSLNWHGLGCTGGERNSYR